MAKYRCPQCGAVHKEDLIHCRLCGSSMGEEGREPILTKKPATARRSSSGLAVALAVGLALVMALALAAVSFGWVGSSETVQQVANNVPGVGDPAPDGWVRIPDEAASWSYELPGPEPSEETVGFSPAVDGLTGWTSQITGLATVSALSGTLDDDPGDRQRQVLEELAAQYVAETSGRVASTDEMTVGGFQALRVEVDDRALDGDFAMGEVVLVLRDDRLYVLDVTSTDEDPPQSDRLLGSVRFS